MRYGFRKRNRTWLVLVAICLAAGITSTIMWRNRRSADASQVELPEVSDSSVKLEAMKSPRVVVEKGARHLTVMDGDQPVKSYRIGLGWGRGDKVKEGDGCTPEGQFYICTKNPQSRYKLSLGLSYPNVEDADRGLRDRTISNSEHKQIVDAIGRGGVPPWKTDLGGEIMIHGRGSAKDWTAGCIAVNDDDIVELYGALKIGTVVTVKP